AAEAAADGEDRDRGPAGLGGDLRRVHEGVGVDDLGVVARRQQALAVGVRGRLRQHVAGGGPQGRNVGDDHEHGGAPVGGLHHQGRGSAAEGGAGGGPDAGEAADGGPGGGGDVGEAVDQRNAGVGACPGAEVGGGATGDAGGVGGERTLRGGIEQR